MAKRANPYTEDFIPQSKIHVGLKQYNNSNDRLKQVYEKTLELLFKGAKKVTEPCPLNNNDLNFIKKDKMKQLFIGKDGSLLHSGSVVVNSKENSKRCCEREMESRCEFCECALCAHCRVACGACEGGHCAACTRARPDGADLCLSCYP